ncbi:MAG TPA: hypothetical protein VHY84_27480 [Bryobacteraceae bacterium]|jgi:hypothetical protein|nr:hypothetical protein [Bryobacteraceae bacterium]
MKEFWLAILIVTASASSTSAQNMPTQEAQTEWEQKFRMADRIGAIDMYIQRIGWQIDDINRAFKAENQLVIKAIAAERNANDAKAISVLMQKQQSLLDQEKSLRLELDRMTLLRKMVAAAPACHALFFTTIDKKASDLTVRETEGVKGCNALELYTENPASLGPPPPVIAPDPNATLGGTTPR